MADRLHAGDPNSIAAKQLTDKQKRDQELGDLGVVLSTLEGRRYIRRLLAHTGVFRAGFTPSSQVYYDNGIRSVGVFIWGEVEEYDPEILIQMLRENAIPKKNG